MKKFIFFVFYALTISFHTSVNALHEGKLSCMYTKWCRNNVDLIKNINHVKTEFPTTNYDNIEDEFNELINNLKRFRVKVFLADKKYFPKKTIGIYNIRNNNIYLNKKYMNNEVQLISTLRHEAWHVAQDCKTGLRSGSLGMIISPKYESESSVDYEVGARIASKNIGMAQAALESCYTNDDEHIIRYFEK